MRRDSCHFPGRKSNKHRARGLGIRVAVTFYRNRCRCDATLLFASVVNVIARSPELFPHRSVPLRGNGGIVILTPAGLRGSFSLSSIAISNGYTCTRMEMDKNGYKGRGSRCTGWAENCGAAEKRAMLYGEISLRRVKEEMFDLRLALGN